MALPPKYIDINLSGGIDAKTDRKLVRPPQTLRADNVRYVTAGSVRKRYGLNFLPPPNPNSGDDVASLGATNTELLASDLSYLYAYSPGGTAWSNRGLSPQTALDVKTVSSYQLPLANSLTSATQQVRQLTYDVIGNLGLAAFDTGDYFDTNNLNYLGSIGLCLFDTITGKAIWQTTINQPYLGPEGSPLAYYLFSSGVFVLNSNNSASSIAPPYGCGYPVVRAYQGQFYIAYISTMYNSYTTSDGVRTNAVFYILNLMRLAPPSQIANKRPVINRNTVTNATSLLTANAPIAAYQVLPSAPLVNANKPPLYFDLATNTKDLTLAFAGQSFAANGAAINGTASLGILSVTSPTQNSATVNVLGQALTDARPLSMASTPLPPTGGVDGGYVVTFANVILRISSPYLSSGINISNASNYATPFVSTPITVAAKQIGLPGSGTFAIYVTDGINYRKLTLAGTSSTPFTQGTMPTVKVDYSRIDNTLLPGIGQVPTLQSRIFFAPDGQPVVWVLLQAKLSSSFNCLALVGLGSDVTPEPSVYAHAFYLRAGVSLAGRQACNAPNNSILAYQVTDVPNQVAAIKYVRLTNTPAPTIVKLNQGALITGADTKYYDGQAVRTAGWLKFPEFYPGLPAALNATGGQLVPTFEYSYVAVWVDFDAYGNAIYSSPSSVTYAGGVNIARDKPINTNSLSFGSVDAFNFLSPSRGKLLLYRTSSLDSLTYRRIPDPTLVKFSSTISLYCDLSPDDNLANPQLYSQPSTNGGELPNDPPPSSLYAVTTIKRPFVSSAENPSWLYFGKPYFPGRPPEFNAEQFLDIDPPSGDITGLAVLDQNVIIFKQERIFVLSGDGPDATGRGVFNNTYAVATDTGCLDPKSIVSTESGVYFRSIRGIQLLDRSLAVSYIGAAVENLIAKSTITSAVLVPGQNQIRFALDSFDPLIDGLAADNVVLVYDYFLKAWSTYGFNPTSDPRYSLKLVGQTTWQNNWFGLAGNSIFQDAGPYATGGIVKFTDGTRKMTVNGVPNVDVPIEVPMTIETPWLPMAGPQGFGRLRRVSVLGDFRSNHVLTLWIFYDYDDNDLYDVPSDPLNLNRKFYKIPFTPDVTLASGAPQEWRVRAPRQVGQSVKFRLTDSSIGEACVITGLLLETSQKSGAPRLPDAQSV